MVIDIHCHVLPGIDDGARNMDESKRMLKMAVQEGIQGIVAASHFECGVSDEYFQKRRQGFEELSQWLETSHLPITLYPGNEIFYSEEVVSMLEEQKAYTMNGTSYVLVEFSPFAPFSYLRMALQRLQYGGFRPILAHMERYQCLAKEERIQALVEMGIYLQVNTSSVTGAMGWRMKRQLMKYIRNGWIHFLGTDAHGTEHRIPQMAQCLKYIEKRAGKSCRERLSEYYPEQMLRGEEISGNTGD